MWMLRGTGCLDSTITIRFSAMDNYPRWCFEILIVLIVFIHIDFHLVDCILKCLSQTISF